MASGRNVSTVDRPEPAKKIGGGEISMAAQATAAAAPARAQETQERSIPAAEVLNKAQSVSADRYQVRREIALGGQGACKVAFDQLAEREVVLKSSVKGQGGCNGERIIKEPRYSA